MTSGSLRARVATVLRMFIPDNPSDYDRSVSFRTVDMENSQDPIRSTEAKPGRHVESKQVQQKEAHDATATSKTFTVGQKVYVRNIGQGQRWLPGQIVETTGPVSFVVRMDGGKTRRCHQDQLRARFTVELNHEESEDEVVASGAITTQNGEDENMDVPVSAGDRATACTTVGSGLFGEHLTSFNRNELGNLRTGMNQLIGCISYRGMSCV